MQSGTKTNVFVWVLNHLLHTYVLPAANSINANVKKSKVNIYKNINQFCKSPLSGDHEIETLSWILLLCIGTRKTFACFGKLSPSRVCSSSIARRYIMENRALFLKIRIPCIVFSQMAIPFIRRFLGNDRLKLSLLD